MSKSDQRKRHRRNSENSNSNSDDGQPRSKKIYTDGYDENFRGSADDRAWLKTLSEREREAELLKRHEQREVLKHHEEISKRLKSKAEESEIKTNDNSDNETKKKSNLLDTDIYAEDDDDEFRSISNRRKQVNASKQKETQHSKSLQVLIGERKKKQTDKPKKSDDLSSSDDEVPEKSSKTKKTEKWDVTEVYATSSSDDDDDDDNHHRSRSRSPNQKAKDEHTKELKHKRMTPIQTKSQLKSMILSRFRMEKWCHSSFFPNVAKGAFVRINIGQNNGVPVYRICEIRDVVETSKVYNLGSTRTNKGLRLKHGTNERVFRLEYVSNNEISDSEFKRWRETTLKQGIPLPTLENVANKIKEIEKCKQHIYNNTDITRIVEEKKRFRKVPINYAMTKNELHKEIDIAKDEHNAKGEAELRKQLNDMEERASELDRKRSESISIITQINRRNRKKTQQNVEMALVREAQESRNVAPNPFTRRPCAPTLVSAAVVTKEELIRELQTRRAADEAAEKQKHENQRLLAEKSHAKKTSSITTTEITTNNHTLPDGNITTMTTNERGSFTSFSENNDDLFTSHNFELDFTIKIFSD